MVCKSGGPDDLPGDPVGFISISICSVGLWLRVLESCARGGADVDGQGIFG